MTQQSVAEMLQTSQSYYAQYENGKRQLPQRHLKTLCLFYGISADYILGLPQGMPYPEQEQ